MSDISREEVEMMLDSHSKSIELSNKTAELDRLRKENKDLITELASNKKVEKASEFAPEEKTTEVEKASEEVEELQEKVEEVVKEGQEVNDGELTDLGSVLAKVVDIEDRLADMTAKMDEFASMFKDVCSSIKTVTPLEAGIGQMSSSSEEVEEKVEEEVKEDVESPEIVATDEEVEAAIEILEKYVDKAGKLPEVSSEKVEIKIEDKPEEDEKEEKVETKVEEKVEDKVEEESSVEGSSEAEVSSLREKIKARKPVNTSSIRKRLFERLEKKKLEKSSIETSSENDDNDGYEAGELAGKLFMRNR